MVYDESECHKTSIQYCKTAVNTETIERITKLIPGNITLLMVQDNQGCDHNFREQSVAVNDLFRVSKEQ